MSNCDFIYSKVVARHDGYCKKVGVHPDLPHTILSCGQDGIVKNIDIREPAVNENNTVTKYVL